MTWYTANLREITHRGTVIRRGTVFVVEPHVEPNGTARPELVDLCEINVNTEQKTWRRVVMSKEVARAWCTKPVTSIELAITDSVAEIDKY